MTDIPEQRTALVTGAGGGMGRDIARQLLARGLRVALADLNPGGPRGDRAVERRARAPPRRRPHPRRRARGGGRRGARPLGPHRRARQQRRLRRDRAVPRHDPAGLGADLRHQRHGARHADHGGGPGDEGRRRRTHRQRHLARLADGAPQLRRLCREQGRRRIRSPAPPRWRSPRTACSSMRWRRG